MTVPLVSILMVARNAAPFIDAAILSAREQSLGSIEILVVDDGSSDGTAQIAVRHAAMDDRVRVLPGPCCGLSAVRNSSLDQARGRFGIVLDSDDMLHPRHVEMLLAAHGRYGAEICASNMVDFTDNGTDLETRAFAQGPQWSAARQIGAGEFVQRGMIGGTGPSLGYLKPLFDLDFIREKGLRYDQRLRIGEDFDLVLRAMLAGARYVFMPYATYYYRRHAASTSHRLAPADLKGLLLATHQYDGGGDDALTAQLRARCDNLEAALRHLDTIAAIKQFQPVQALRLAIGNRAALALSLTSFGEALAKRAGCLAPPRSRKAPSARVSSDALPDRLRAFSQALQSAAPYP